MKLFFIQSDYRFHVNNGTYCRMLFRVSHYFNVTKRKKIYFCNFVAINEVINTKIVIKNEK